MEILFWIGIGILVIILTAGIVFCLPSIKGWAGERIVRTILNSLSKEEYIVLNNVKFYGKEKENKIQGSYKSKRWSCQIDHLVISVYGIFCIETKNYLGRISGNYIDKYLQRKVLGMRYQTYSPIYQNYRHLQRLVEKFPLIKYHSKDLHSIICFMPGGNPVIYDKGAAIICKAQDLKKEIMKSKNKVLTLEECKEIANQIKSITYKKG